MTSDQPQPVYVAGLSEEEVESLKWALGWLADIDWADIHRCEADSKAAAAITNLLARQKSQAGLVVLRREVVETLIYRRDGDRAESRFEATIEAEAALAAIHGGPEA